MPADIRHQIFGLTALKYIAHERVIYILLIPTPLFFTA